jgi:type IV pilus assembly protein PilA
MLNLAQLREKREKGEEGFTLIELLVVVVIIGILIAIAIPLYLNYKKGAADKATQSDVRNAISVLEQCNTDNTTYPAALGTAASSAYAAMTGCTGGRINYSSNSTLTYTAAPASCAGTAASACTSYTLVGTSGSSGNSKTYTYSSTTGQTVTT